MAQMFQGRVWLQNEDLGVSLGAIGMVFPNLSVPTGPGGGGGRPMRPIGNSGGGGPPLPPGGGHFAALRAWRGGGHNYGTHAYATVFFATRQANVGTLSF